MLTAPSDLFCKTAVKKKLCKVTISMYVLNDLSGKESFELM